MKIDLAQIAIIDAIIGHEERILAAALYYTQVAGLTVLPLRPDEKILPPQATGINYQSGSRNKATIAKWFGPGGKFEGWNIGLPTGKMGGIVALDIDEPMALEALKKQYGADTFAGPMQTTPRGGVHYIYQYSTGITNSTGKIAKYVDTRGGADGTCGGHVAAWPSVVDGKKYGWGQGGEITAPPPWLVTVIHTTFKAGTGRGNEEVKDEDREEKFSVEDIQRILNGINPEKLSYDEWLQVGQAVNTQLPDPNTGLKLWDLWSRRDTKRYKLGDCHRRWRKFQPMGSIRIGTLMFIAKRFGAIIEDPSGVPIIREFDQLVEDMNKDNGIVCVGDKLRYAVRNPTQDRKFILFTKSDFKDYYADKSVVVVTKKKKEGRVSLADIWLSHENRRVCYNGLTIAPNEGLWTPDSKVNMWSGWGIEPEKGDWTRIEHYILNVVCSGNYDNYNYLVDWLAHIMQVPAKPAGVAVAVLGEEGCGKTTLDAIMAKILGDHHLHIHDDRILDRFNSLTIGKMLINFDEAVWAGGRKMLGALKNIITQSTIVVEQKGIDAFVVPNIARLYITSNENFALPAGINSRRFWALRCSPKWIGNHKYFDNLYQAIEGHEPAAFMHHLLHERKIISTLNLAPVTEELTKQREIYQVQGDPISRWFDDARALRVLGVGSIDVVRPGEPMNPWPRAVEKTALYHAFLEWSRNNRSEYKFGSSNFFTTVEKLGFRPTRLGPRQDRKYCYTVPPLKDEEGETDDS